MKNVTVSATHFLKMAFLDSLQGDNLCRGDLAKTAENSEGSHDSVNF